jgi:hypothetical protein
LGVGDVLGLTDGDALGLADGDPVGLTLGLGDTDAEAETETEAEADAVRGVARRTVPGGRTAAALASAEPLAATGSRTVSDDTARTATARPRRPSPGRPRRRPAGGEYRSLVMRWPSLA